MPKLKILISLTIILVLNVLLVLGVYSYVKAQRAEETQTTFGVRVDKFPFLSMVSLGASKVGFFDAKEGKLYIYNVNSNQCEKILQLQGLGSPLLALRKY